MTIVIEDPFVLYSVLLGILGLVGIVWSGFQIKKNREILKELKARERQMNTEILKYAEFVLETYNHKMYDEAFANAYKMGYQHASLEIPALYEIEDVPDKKSDNPLIGFG